MVYKLANKTKKSTYYKDESILNQTMKTVPKDNPAVDLVLVDIFLRSKLKNLVQQLAQTLSSDIKELTYNYPVDYSRVLSIKIDDSKSTPK